MKINWIPGKTVRMVTIMLLKVFMFVSTVQVGPKTRASLACPGSLQVHKFFSRLHEKNRSFKMRKCIDAETLQAPGNPLWAGSKASGAHGSDCSTPLLFSMNLNSSEFLGFAG